MSGRYRREQRRAMWIAGIVAIIVIAVAAPLLMLPDFRLSVGQRLGIAPGENADRLYGPDAGAELIVAQQSVPVTGTAPYVRYVAVAIAVQESDDILAKNLANGRQVRLPLTTYDLLAASSDRTWLLFVSDQASGGQHAVLWSLTTNEVKPLPTGDVTPTIPGDWTNDISGQSIVCGGVSPHDTWVACLTNRSSNRNFFFGDWQLQISPFGQPNQIMPLYRGNGTLPIVGWSSDERYLYFQNEKGLWRLAVPKPTHPPPVTRVASPVAVR